MSQMLSYSVAYTPIDSTSTTVVIAQPAAFAAGDLLVMGVIAGGTAGAVEPTGVTGNWTKPSGSGKPGVFYKLASGSEPPTYTVTLQSAATAAVFIAAYPSANIVSTTFLSSANGVASYTPAFPSGVSDTQTVLLIGAAVSDGLNSGWGGSNFDFTSAWETQVPVFGAMMPSNSTKVMPSSIGMSDTTGVTESPTLSAPLLCQIFVCYIVVDITGENTSVRVTATASYLQGLPGMALTVKALSGAASVSQIVAGAMTAQLYAGGSSLPPQLSITPNGSGSIIYGAVTENFNVTSGTSYTADANTTFSQNIADSTWTTIYGTFESTSATTSGSEVTLGASAPDNAYLTAVLAEILAASGSTISEVASAASYGTVPGNFPTVRMERTVIFLSPPPEGSLLVAMISANSSWPHGNTTFTITDTFGYIWTPLAEVYYPSYSGVWIASPTVDVTFSLPVAAEVSAAHPVTPTGVDVTFSLPVAQAEVAAYAVMQPAIGNLILDETEATALVDEASNFLFDEAAGAGNITIGLPVAEVKTTVYAVTRPVTGNFLLDETETEPLLDEAGNDLLAESSASVTINLPAAAAVVAAYPVNIAGNVFVGLPSANVTVTAYSIVPANTHAMLEENLAPTAVNSGTSYTAGAWIWTEQQSIVLGITWLASNGTVINMSSGTFTIQPSTWTYISVTETAPEGTTAAYPFVEALGANASFYAAHVTITDASAEVPYMPDLGLDYDNTYLQNTTQASLTQGASTLIAPIEKNEESINEYLTRGPQQVSVNGSSAQDAYDVAYWYLTKYAQPQYRAAVVTVDPASNPQLFTPVLQFDIADVAKIVRRPIGAPPYTLPVICQQVTLNIGPGKWTAAYQMSPYVQENEVLVLDAEGEDTLGSSTLAW